MDGPRQHLAEARVPKGALHPLSRVVVDTPDTRPIGREGTTAPQSPSAEADDLVQAAERLVTAVAREQAARRDGYWSPMHEQSVSFSSMAVELALIKSRAAVSCG